MPAQCGQCLLTAANPPFNRGGAPDSGLPQPTDMPSSVSTSVKHGGGFGSASVTCNHHAQPISIEPASTLCAHHVYAISSSCIEPIVGSWKVNALGPLLSMHHLQRLQTAMQHTFFASPGPSPDEGVGISTALSRNFSSIFCLDWACRSQPIACFVNMHNANCLAFSR